MLLNHLKLVFSLFALIVLVCYGCQEPIIVGSELVSEDEIGLKFNDTLPLISTTILGERVATHFITGTNTAADVRTYLLGKLSNPIYGSVSSGLYFTFSLGTSLPTFSEETNPIRFDSMVLLLRYDTIGNSGLLPAEHDVSLFQLSEALNINKSYYSDTLLNYVPLALVSKKVLVNLKDSVSVINHANGNPINLAPHLRIRIPDELGISILTNDIANAKDVDFRAFIKGFYLESKPTNQNSLYGLNLSQLTVASGAPTNRLVLYYTVADTIKKSYQYVLNNTTASRYTHDYTGSEIEKSLNSSTRSEEFSFLQGIAGAKTKISFPDLSFLQDKLINKIVLELPIAENELGNTFTDFPVQLIASRKNSAGILNVIPDIAQVGVALNVLRPVFGGFVVTTNNQKKYELNITNHIKSALKIPNYDSDIYLTIGNESETASKAILYGSKGLTNRMKLKVYYSIK